jgi:hypothetical protein
VAGVPKKTLKSRQPSADDASMNEDLKRFQPVTVAPAVYAGIQRAREQTQEQTVETLARILGELGEAAALNWLSEHRAIFRLGLRVGFTVREIELETDGLR